MSKGEPIELTRGNQVMWKLAHSPVMTVVSQDKVIVTVAWFSQGNYHKAEFKREDLVYLELAAPRCPMCQRDWEV